MAQSIFLRTCIAQSRSTLLPSISRLTSLSLAGIHSSVRLCQEVARGPTGKGVLQESSGYSKSSNDVRSVRETIKENTKKDSYAAIILAGLGVTGIVLYAIWRNLIERESPYSVYVDAFARVVDDPRVHDALGLPLMGYGGITTRKCGHHAGNRIFEWNGMPHMQMEFYVRGLRNKATIHLESRRNTAGKQELHYLHVKLDYYPYTTIVLEDNRASDPQPQPKTSEFGTFDLMSCNRDGK